MEESIVMQKIREWLKSKESPINSTNSQLEELEKLENPAPEPQPAQNMADGGMVQPNESDWDQVKGWLTSSDRSAMPVSSPALPPSKVPAVQSPTNYRAKAQEMLGNPQDRTEMVQRLNQPSLGEKLGLLGTGIGDSIVTASGYGNPGHQQALQNRYDASKGMQLDAFDKERAMNKDEMELASQLESKDEQSNPNSETSKAAQATYGPLLIKAGFKPQDIAKMPAKLISDLTGKSVDFRKVESEEALAKATLGLNANKFDFERENAKALAEAKAQELAAKGKEDALSEFNKHPLINTAGRMLGMSSATELANKAGLGEEKFKAPYGEQVMRNGKLYLWDPAVAKYRAKG